MKVSVRDIHNDMIKPFKNDLLDSIVNSMTQKVLISDTTLRLFIPPQFRKMTPKLRQICECELCIIPKDTQIDLNIFRTIIVMYLQQKSSGIHTRNSLFSNKSAAH